MVAKQGRGWTLAACLIAMEAEANVLAPKRSRIADGSVGDLAHASRSSDHNPSLGFVTALDLTHDPGGGFDAHARARLMVARRDSRIKYVISNRQVARSYWSTVTSANRAIDRSQEVGGRIPPWVWAHYTGSNPHVHHAHTSVANTATARDNTSPWWPSTAKPLAVPQEADDMLAIIIGIYVEHEDIAGHWLEEFDDGVQFWKKHGAKVGEKQLITDMLGAIWAQASKR